TRSPSDLGAGRSGPSNATNRAPRVSASIRGAVEFTRSMCATASPRRRKHSAGSWSNRNGASLVPEPYCSDIPHPVAALRGAWLTELMRGYGPTDPHGRLIHWVTSLWRRVPVLVD